MSTPELRMSDDLALPIDAVTETFLIFGKKGSGKTATAGVFTEELIMAGLPVAVVDPMDAWWGLRSNAEGTGPGLPALILGGEHADLPLPPDSGTRTADLVVEERIPVVLSLFLMSKTQQRQFVMEFMERLFRRNRDPLHLIVDEADRWAPQRGTHDMARLLGAYEDIVLRGRRLGIGSTSITLRVAQLHSAIRSQVEVLVAMRMLGRLDVQAIDEWVRLHATEEDAAALKASLPSLPVGTAWFWSPGWLEIMAKIRVRPRRTFDSSATPRVGQQRIVPREFARVDAADLERMAVLLTRDDDEAAATAGKPSKAAGAELRREIARLSAELNAVRAQPREVEVPVVQHGEIAAVEQIVAGLRDAAAGLELALSRAARPAAVQSAPVAAAATPRRREAPAPAAAPEDGAPALKSGARRMLAVLARQHPVKVTRAQLGALSGFTARGGTFRSYLSTLRLAGLVTEDGPHVVLTPAGFDATGTDPGEPVTVDELRETWRSHLKTGVRTMLDLLIDRYPEGMTRSELASMAGFEEGGGTFRSYLSTLRRNDLVSESDGEIFAADVFFLAPAG
jgi:uncharacterized protein